MKAFMNILFYSICFLTLATVIYRLGFSIPPDPEEKTYLQYCISVGALSVLISGAAVGFAASFDWYRRRGNKR